MQDKPSNGLSLLRDSVRSCQKCELRACSISPIPGLGKETARLMIVGTSPSKEEDIISRAITGRKESILKEFFKAAGILNSSVYYTNLVKCFPAKSTVEDSSILACKAWLWEEIKLIKPKVICSLGLLPTKTLLRGKKSWTMAKYVGSVISYPESFGMSGYICPLYGLDFLIRNSGQAAQTTIKHLSKVKELIDG